MVDLLDDFWFFSRYLVIVAKVDLIKNWVVLDHWMNSDLFMFSRKKYNLYKLLVLYWAQNPHSRGAYLLYKYVIQKPVEEEEEPEEETRPAYIEQEKKESYRLIDGYTPPNIQNQSNSSVSSDDDSIGSHHHTEEDQSIHITLSSQKEVSLTPMLTLHMINLYTRHILY